MMRALFAGVTGLRSHQTKMDVIGNNIANVNTLGFKKSAANFADLYSETTTAASAPTGSKGGTNSSQIGLGVACNAIVVKHTPGAPSYTGNTLDLAISGDGFFTVRTGPNGETAYTRAGNLSVSSNGSLVTSAGYFVQTFNSVYQQGDAGYLSSSAGVNGASATGFNSFVFNERDTDVQRAASGTYTMALSDTNKVNLYKNGVLVQEGIDVMYANPEDPNEMLKMTETGELLPNTTYSIDLPGLGTITFRTDGHTLSTTGLKANTSYNDIKLSQAVDTTAGKGLAEYLPQGSYKITPVTNEDGTITGYEMGVTGLPESFTSNFQEGSNEKLITVDSVDSAKIVRTDDGKGGYTYRLEVLDNDGQWTSGISLNYGTPSAPVAPPDANGRTTGGLDANGNLLKSSTYKLSTPLGEITFVTDAENTVANPFAVDGGDVKADGDTSFNKLFADSGFTVGTQPTEGSGTNYRTGLSYLSSLLQNASISITNNDGFHSGPSMSDMVIDQDMYQNVMVNDTGAVVAQLKVDAVYDPMTGEVRPMTLEDANNESLTKMAAGESVIVGYLAMANFSNPEGLDKIGTNLYATTANSGVPMYGIAGDDGFGSIVGSSLEMSNVDLSEEMVNMITTQRGFQANSRIITVTDTMLEELINLKR